MEFKVKDEDEKNINDSTSTVTLVEADIESESLNAEEDELSLPLARFKCEKWIKTSAFTGIPKSSNFRKMKEEVSLRLQDGDIVVQALLWTVDHFMRLYNVPSGSVMIGEQVGRVTVTNNVEFPVDSLLICSQGWRTHSVVNPRIQPVLNVSHHNNLPLSLYLDTLGYPGLLAYYAVCHKCNIKSGDVVVVNAAAGAVGNVVAQLVKLKGCDVNVFCGSNEQMSWLRSVGFDHVFNYKKVKPSSMLQLIAPSGVDVYFDCVGTEFTMDVISMLKPSGSTFMFGQVQSYDQTTLKGHTADPYHLIMMKNGQVTADSLVNHKDLLSQMQNQLLQLILEGKFHYKQEIFTGFDALPDALANLYDGSRVGKIIVMSESHE